MLLALALVLLSTPLAVNARPNSDTGATRRRLFLPVTSRGGSAAPAPAPTPAPGGCPTTSGNGYSRGVAYQWDTDNPVRPAYNHADKNLDLRGYAATSATRGLVNYGSDDPTQPPQFATLFNPNRVPAFNTFRVYNWNWAPSPNPGTRGSLYDGYPVSALGLATTAGEALHVPGSGYDIGAGMEVIVLYADADTVAFKYTREDSVGPNGYTLHVDNICTDPNLLAVYNSLDAASGPRYVYVGQGYGYDLPTLAAGQVFGTARGSEIVIAIADTGAFMDPRSCNEWWQIRPGQGC